MEQVSRPEGRPFLILGVDPGLKGALAFYDFREKRIHAVFDMPTKKIQRRNGKEQSELEYFELATIIDFYAKDIALAVIEDVAEFNNGKEGLVSMFNFGFVTGVVTGMILNHGIQLTKIKPNIWKPMIGLSRDKKQSITRVTDMFPLQAQFFQRVKDADRAEALLLATIGERFL